MKRKSMLFLLFPVASACILPAAKITTDHNHSMDLSQHHTYSWLEVKAGDLLWPDRIRTAVGSQLAAKGWNKVETGDASVAGVSQFEHGGENCSKGISTVGRFQGVHPRRSRRLGSAPP
jgi:hypothetical protein